MPVRAYGQNRECPKDKTTIASLTSRKSPPGHPGLEMTGQTTAAKTNRECPKDGKTTARLTSRKSPPGHPGLEMTGWTTQAKTNRACPKDEKTITRLTSRHCLPGHPGQLHRNLIFLHFFSSQIPGKIMSNDSIYLFHFFLSYFLVAKTEAERPRFLHFPETSRPSAKSSKIIQNPPIDFFSTQWYSVLSTQRD